MFLAEWLILDSRAGADNVKIRIDKPRVSCNAGNRKCSKNRQ